MKIDHGHRSAALALQDVHFSYGGSAVLEAVSLAFHPGSLVAVVGPNGCGKSTLLKVVAGLVTPKHGHVLLDGQAVSSLSRRQIGRRLAMLAQSNEAPDGMIVADLVGMGRFVHEGWLARSSPADLAQINDAMRLMDVSDLATHRIGELSGGQLQRCRMAMALAQDAGILLLDEPTNHLDLKHQYGLLDIARQQARQGRAVIAVLHDLTQASLYADRVVLMHEGRVYADGAPAEVLTTENIEAVYGVATLSQTFGRAIVHLPQTALQAPSRDTVMGEAGPAGDRR